MGAVRPFEPRAADDRRIGKRTVGLRLHRQLAFFTAEAVEMRDDLVDVHHVGILVMQVEQIDLVREQAAVEAAFLHQHDVEAVRIGVDRRGAHAARGALAADDDGLDAELGQMRQQRRAVEAAGALLGDDDVAGLRLELGPDGVERGIARHVAAAWSR